MPWENNNVVELYAVLIIIMLILLLVYSPFSDRAGLPLVVVDLPLLRVAVDGSDNPITLE